MAAMAHSFTADALVPESNGTSLRRRVLVTGGGGRIGSYFAEHSHGKYDLILVDRDLDEDAMKLQKYGQVVQGDITDLPRMKELCRGVDTVLHLTATPNPSAKWVIILPVNLTGTYNTMVAAKSAGVRRLIFASSIHAVSGYPTDVQVKTSEPVNPGDLYGVSKCFGEALARYMAEQEGLSCICLRIGAFQPIEAARGEHSLGMLDAWVSHRDLNQLIERCIDDTRLQFAVFHGLSDNRFKRLDISDARELVGYAPQDDLTDEHPILKKLNFDETVNTHSMDDESQQSGLRGQL